MIEYSNRVWSFSKQQGTKLILLLALADMTNEKDLYCFPSLETLQQRSRLANRQNVIRSLADIEKDREVWIEHSRGRNHSNAYIVTTGMDVNELAKILVTKFQYTPEDAIQKAHEFIKNVSSEAHLSRKENVSSERENVSSERENVSSELTKCASEDTLIISNQNRTVIEPEEGDARADQPTEPTQPPAPPPLPATNAFGTKLADARMRYDDPPTGPKTPPPIPEKPRPRKHGRVTSPHIDPRKFKNGFVVAGEGATAVEVYYERFAIGDDKARLSAPLEDDLIAHCPDLDRLRGVIEAYSRTAYKPRNMQLIFDWYAKGITQNGQEKKAYDHRKQPTTRPEPAHARPDLYEQFGWGATAPSPA